MEHVIINGNVATFEAELVSETSATATRLGNHFNRMTFGLCDGRSGQGYIEWEYSKAHDTWDEDYTEIGIWFENISKKVTDYDGVFELPREAVYLLESLGYDCSEVKA